MTEWSSHYISLFVDLPDALTSLDCEELRTTGGPLKINGYMYCTHFDFELLVHKMSDFLLDGPFQTLFLMKLAS